LKEKKKKVSGRKRKRRGSIKKENIFFSYGGNEGKKIRKMETTKKVGSRTLRGWGEMPGSRGAHEFKGELNEKKLRMRNHAEGPLASP